MSLSQVYVTCKGNRNPLYIIWVINETTEEYWAQGKPPRKAFFHFGNKQYPFFAKGFQSVLCLPHVTFCEQFASLPIKILCEIFLLITVDFIY